MEPLVRSLSAPEEQVRGVTMMALSRIGAPAASLLIEALGDERQKAREGAKLALIRIGEPGVEQLVEAFAKARGDLLREIVDVLVEIGDLRALRPMMNALPDARGEMQQVLIKALVTFGEPAVDALIEAMLDLDFREAAMEALVAFKDLAVGKLCVALKDRRWEMRWRAARALGELRRAGALEPLIGVLEDNRREVRRAGVDALRKIGDTRAVESLIKALSDEDDGVRWEAATALGELRGVLAIKPLIAALTDEAEPVRKNAASALIEIGPAIVEPLIETLYERGSRRTGTYDYVVSILGKISTRYEIQDPSRADLAAAYCKLLTGEYTLNELLPALRELSWWQHGSELYRLFRMLDSAMRCQSIEEVTIERKELDQLSNSLRWLLYTDIRIWLRNLSKIIEDIALYRMSSIEETREDALVRAKVAATKLEDLAAEFTDPETRILQHVSEHLNRLTIEAIGRRTKRAELQLILRTAEVRIPDPNSPTVLAYDLANIGDAPAWNLSIAFKAPQRDGFTVVEGGKKYPLLLNPREKRQIEFYVMPGEARYAEPSLEVRYDDPRREGHFERLSGGRVHFDERVTRYEPIGPSPYTRKAVNNPEMFYGRDDTLKWVDRNIRGAYQDNILVLHGQRRTGKTSVLLELERRAPKTPHIFVRFDLQYAELECTSDLFYEIASLLYTKLTTEFDLHVQKPALEEYASYPWRRFRDFHQELQAHLGDKHVVLMVDEFDILIDKVRKSIVTQDAFHRFRWLMQESKTLTFIFTGAYELRKMLLDRTSFLFNIAKPRRIRYLEKKFAKKLVTDPMAGLLDYHPLAVDKILRVTACHPFYVQCVCDSLVRLARNREKNYIDLSDVNEALAKVIEEDAGNLSWDYGLLSREEQVILAALAFISDEWTFVPTREIEATLRLHGFSAPNVSNVLRELRDQDFIEERQVRQEYQYRFCMELLRVWLEQNEMLLRLKEEIG
ncbi:MAG: HEAT repeat domain-containing protein [Chloroflexi bacterium]|nr:HEAT repeat domain-containing protein [Chloroflexota bacterium]